MIPSGFFVLRTPLLPFDDFSRWGEGLEAPRAAREGLEAALSRDAAALRTRLVALVRRPEVREAIFLASEGLEASIDGWIEAPESERGRKVERALVRYLSRMTARATPFGLFGGYSVGAVGDRSGLSLAGLEHYRRR